MTEIMTEKNGTVRTDEAKFFLPGMEETNDFISVESQRSRLNSEKFQSKLSMKIRRFFTYATSNDTMNIDSNHFK